MRAKTALITGFLIALAGCSGTARTMSTHPKTSANVRVTLADFRITPAGSLGANAPGTLVFENAGMVQHQVAIEAAGSVIKSSMMGVADTSTVSLPALEPGSYTMYCTIPGHREAGMEATLVVGGTALGTKSMSADDMLRSEQAIMKSYPAKTAGTGGTILAPTVENGVKVFRLTAKKVRWEVTPGHFVDAFGYNGIVPGPEIHVRRGDKIKVVFRNELPEASTVHWHGLTVPNGMDGVPFLTQDPVLPGKTFVYEFPVVDPPGTYMYHAHENSTYQVGHGLLGAFIVDPPKHDWSVAQTVVLNDGDLGYTINGKGFPGTVPIVAPLGSKVLIRFINEGQLIHPMHLHGYHFSIVARDGRPIAPYVADTQEVAPGERFDVVFTASNPGAWAFHCHILSHVEGPNGMFGMATAVIVK